MDDTPVVIGAQLGPDRVESLLGIGGMAPSTAPQTPCFPARSDQYAAVRRGDGSGVGRTIWAEAQVLAALNHPNVGAIYGFVTLNGSTGLASGPALELVEDPTLAER